ncbi:hypothetical protein MTP99_011441 [Tenebrio molitor]|nr:hypothetical protein MTP99_011441 [Tenebrio molitor]
MINSREVAASLASFLSKSVHISTKNTQQFVRLACGKTSEFGGNGIGQVGSDGDNTVGALFEKWRQKFAENSIPESRESIEDILAHCLGTARISDVYKFKRTVLSEARIKEMERLCSKRLKRMPIQYVLGEWPFRQVTLKMSPPVFIPRPETEQLVELVSGEIVRKGARHVLDLCCGSGAISLALLREHPAIKATAVDQSAAACQLTKENAQRNGLNGRIRIIRSQLTEWGRREKFDIIVSNPPYVFSEDLDGLQDEIKLYEDLAALDGGRDGLVVIKTILELSSECLNENGKLFVEVEPRHPRLLRDCLRAPGLAHVRTFKDFCGKDRFVEMIKIEQ